VFAHTRDGTKLAYSILGDPTAPSKIALIHSLAMDRAFWRPAAERLAGDACVLTYDCRGHGESDKPAGPFDLDMFADDLADLLDAVKWSAAVVGGASMGGSVALAFAQRHAARVRGLALFDTTAWYGADARKAWAERGDKALEHGLAALVEFQKTRWFSDAFRRARPEVVQACVDVFLRNEPGAYAQTCAMLGAFDLRAGLSRMRMPTRIIVGEEDYATPPAMARAMHEGIEGSSLAVLAGARHLTPLEAPDRAAEEIRALL